MHTELALPPPLSERQNRPCASCIGVDDEAYMTACWIREDNGDNRHQHDYAGSNPIPCPYDVMSHEHIAFIDSLIKIRGEDGSNSN
jgi:hypothetical protein